MDKTVSTGAGTSKRSITSSGDDENASGAKKMKSADSVDGVKDSVSSLNTSSQPAVKRLGDPLRSDSPCQSPSKKRKTTDSQSDSGKKQRCGSDDKKKRRTKNKALLKAVIEQMEFYFSDSNLGKDRFLRKKYDESEDGYIDLSVFGNFNKLKTLHKDGISGKILCKALAKSELLEVSEDGTRVKRRTPFKELDPKEVDRRTVYVEHLPTHATHIWIKKIFSQCGQVSYVSLPKYKTTKEMKGFAFVEFTLPEEAEKACAMLNNPPQEKNEEKPGKFPKGNKDLYRLQKSAPPITGDEKDITEGNNQCDPKEDQNSAPTNPTKKKKKKKLKKSNEEPVEKNTITTEQNESQDEKKKKKKKKKKQPTEGGVGDKDTTVTSKSQCDSEEDKKLKELDNVKEKSEETESNLKTKSEDVVVKKKKKKKRGEKTTVNIEIDEINKKENSRSISDNSEIKDADDMCVTENTELINVDVELKNAQDGSDVTNNEAKLSRREKKLMRQADIRRKKAEGLFENRAKENKDIQSVPKVQESSKEVDVQKELSTKKMKRQRLESVVSESSETDDSSKVRKKDGSQLTSCLVKSKKQDIIKKVEFNPVPVTTEFVERKEVRRRKKAKREGLHLRVLSKQDWLDLRAEYISKQKSHMSALKESLRKLRMEEMGNQPEPSNGTNHVDLTQVFGTKRMKPSQDIKLAHVEQLSFIPNVIVQWNCSHEINRNVIKTLFKEIDSDRIAYIESKEVARSGFIRFKDEESAEKFATLARSMNTTFSARVLPESQQASYWEKANRDRIEKLSKKKKERGSDKIARKVFERNKATFLEKGTRIVFDNDEDDMQESGEVNTIKKKNDEPDEDANTSTKDVEEELVQGEKGDVAAD